MAAGPERRPSPRPAARAGPRGRRRPSPIPAPRRASPHRLPVRHDLRGGDRGAVWSSDPDASARESIAPADRRPPRPPRRRPPPGMISAALADRCALAPPSSRYSFLPLTSVSSSSPPPLTCSFLLFLFLFTTSSPLLLLARVRAVDSRPDRLGSATRRRPASAPRCRARRVRLAPPTTAVARSARRSAPAAHGRARRRQTARGRGPDARSH